MKKLLSMLSVLCLAAVGVVGLSGCASTSSAATTGAAPEPAKAAAAPVAANETVVENDLLSVVKRVPAAVALGEQYTVEMIVTAKQAISQAVVTDQVPEGARLVSTAPQAQASGANLSWNLGDMNKGDVQKLAVTLQAAREGKLTCCTTINAVPRGCVGTMVGRAVLAIDKSGPTQALLGETVPFVVVVKNVGTSVARKVVMTDTVPAGLKHQTGRTPLAIDLGDMAPGESKTVAVPLQAMQRGEFVNQAVAKAENTDQVQDTAPVRVVQRGLEITKKGTEWQFTRREARYEIVVTNTGDVPLTNVVVTDTAPQGTSIVSAPGATIKGNEAAWTVGSLPGGEKRTFELVLTSDTPGKLCNVAKVASTEGLTASAEACTDWRGVPAVLIEVVDTVDPLLPGESTVYVITVTNQGTARDTNVGLVVNFPEQTNPVSATGASATRIEGKKVTLTPVPVLEAKQAVEWRVTARAAKAGDSRVSVELTTDLLKTPVTEEEATQVY